MCDMLQGPLSSTKSKQANEYHQWFADKLCQQATKITSITGAQDIISVATSKMLVTVGKMLVENRAMLLPTIHSEFNMYAKSLFHNADIDEPLN